MLTPAALVGVFVYALKDGLGPKQNAIQRAAQARDYSTLQHLFTEGKHPDDRNDSDPGGTALERALLDGDFEMAEFLASQGADDDQVRIWSRSNVDDPSGTYARAYRWLKQRRARRSSPPEKHVREKPEGIN